MSQGVSLHGASPKIDVLIPARNEEEALPILLKEMDRSYLRQIVVVDNGSTDRTAAVAVELGCVVVPCPKPGYGGACLAGMAHLAQNPPDLLVFLDGDRSDDPSQMRRLIDPILADEQDFVLGSRALGQAEKGSLTITQRFGNALATTLMNFFWKSSYTDLGPFRAISWSALSQLAMQDPNFGWTIEMQIKATAMGLRVIEEPVPYRNRIGTSKISGTLNGVVKAGYKILFTIFKYRFLQRPIVKSKGKP